MTDRLEEARKRIEAQRAEREKYDPLIEFGKLSEDLSEEKRYPHRDEIPEALHQFSDWYTQKTGQQPDKKVLSDWIDTFWYWHSKALDISSLEQAFDNFDVVWRPGTLTNTAVALKAKARATYHEPEIFRASEQPDKKYTPMPADVRRRIELALGKSAHEPKHINEVMKGMQK